MALLSLLALSVFSAINTNNYAQADDELTSISGSGQIAMAHWEDGLAVTIDAFFAEQLKVGDEIIPNGLYIEMLHYGLPSVSYKSLNDDADSTILCDAFGLHIITEMPFKLYGRDYTHIITLNWASDMSEISSDVETASGVLYTATATIAISGQYHLSTFPSEWAAIGETESSDVTAVVTKEKGNMNTLTISVTDFFSDGTTTEVTENFSINNNAADTYTVGNHNVFVDTKGNDQIRACYIVK
jgi:hypothetical protein